MMQRFVCCLGGSRAESELPTVELGKSQCSPLCGPSPSLDERPFLVSADPSSNMGIECLLSTEEEERMFEPRQGAGVSSPSKCLTQQTRIDFNDLTFHRLIGKGTCKAVYQGRWNNTGVAILCMRKGGKVTEARLLQRLSNHPNIVQFFRGAMDTKGNEYMVMELVRKGSLDQLLMKHGRSLQTRVRLSMSEQICSAMTELASERIVHRDLAARNVLVAGMDPVLLKVSDFGLTRVLEADTDIYTTPLVNLPSIPIRWSSPEVLNDFKWSEKSDVWSFGVTMWEIFSGGNEPYACMSDQEVFLAVSASHVLEKPMQCPPEVYTLMLQCWNGDPVLRPSFSHIMKVFKGWRDTYLYQKDSSPVASSFGGSSKTWTSKDSSLNLSSLFSKESIACLGRYEGSTMISELEESASAASNASGCSRQPLAQTAGAAAPGVAERQALQQCSRGAARRHSQSDVKQQRIPASACRARSDPVFDVMMSFEIDPAIEPPRLHAAGSVCPPPADEAC